MLCIRLPATVSGVAKPTLNQVLLDGLTKLCREKPAGLEAVRELARYLYAHNPNRPQVEEPDNIISNGDNCKSN